MLKIKCDINQQYLKTVDLHFVKSELFSLTWSCGTRQRNTTSSGWKFRLNNLAVRGFYGVNQKTEITHPYFNKENTEYVKSYMSKHKRRLMVQFLTGILPLKIETGRFKKIWDTSSGKLRYLNSQERICEMYTLSEPEDKIHFLCSSCTLYISFRKLLFDKAINFNVDFQSFSNTNKLIWLITNNCCTNFLLAAWQTRSSVLFFVK